MNEKAQKEILNMSLRLGFSVLPFGQLFNDLLDFQSKMKQERLNTFLQSFCDYLSSHKDISMDTLKNEDFADLFESVVKRAVQTKSKDKQERFKHILINQIQAQNFDIDNSETYLDLVSNLSEMEISILKNHYEKDELVRKLGTKREDIAKAIKQQEEILSREKDIHDKGHANNYQREKSKLQNLQVEQDDNKEALEELQKYRTAEFYKQTENQFVYYNQSLYSKGLLLDNGFGSTWIKPFHSMSISEFGKQFCDFLKQ